MQLPFAQNLHTQLSPPSIFLSPTFNKMVVLKLTIITDEFVPRRDEKLFFLHICNNKTKLTHRLDAAPSYFQDKHIVDSLLNYVDHKNIPMDQKNYTTLKLTRLFFHFKRQSTSTRIKVLG